MSVTLRKVAEGDLEQIMRWRMDPEITRYMNTDPKLTLEGQKKWFAKVQQDPDVSYWIIEIDGTAAGVINYTGLTNPTGDLGWAYYVGEKKLRSIQTALALEMSMYDHAFLDLGKNAVYSDVFTLNQGVIQLHKICGCASDITFCGTCRLACAAERLHAVQDKSGHGGGYARQGGVS